MKGHAVRNEERMLQLLADHATEGLSTIETRELDDLLVGHPNQDKFALERAAAAIEVAMLPRVMKPMPSPLRDRILIDAGRFLGNMDSQLGEQRAVLGAAQLMVRDGIDREIP